MLLEIKRPEDFLNKAYASQVVTTENIECFPNTTQEEQKPVVELVDQILTAKKADPKSDTSSLENQIDQLVYQLYNLTPEEIALVEGKA